MWAPDFVFGLAPRWSRDKNVYLTAHYEPGGSALRLVEEDIVDEDWLMWITSEELRHHVDYPNGLTA
ncbi:hypothetical protein XH92_36030 [Bradyrhizobium sp. CCBAU 53421]|nr:hypothetical protein XH92_36030 [Bradyrhizobium sp. CCBAU 53421]